MKRILTIICTLFLLAGPIRAQRGLKTYPVFQGEVVPTNMMVVTEVRGGMAAYKLDYYKGVTSQVDEALAAKVASLVESDAAETDDCETEKTGTMLTYALIRPKSEGRINRYLCYQARPVEGQWKITVLYLEGPATLSDLRTMFEKQ